LSTTRPFTKSECAVDRPKSDTLATPFDN
jgi:hypothetical protein